MRCPVCGKIIGSTAAALDHHYKFTANHGMRDSIPLPSASQLGYGEANLVLLDCARGPRRKHVPAKGLRPSNPEAIYPRLTAHDPLEGR